MRLIENKLQAEGTACAKTQKNEAKCAQGIVIIITFEKYKNQRMRPERKGGTGSQRDPLFDTIRRNWNL